MISQLKFEPARYSEHCRGDNLAAHRHRHAYAALILEGGYVECGVNGVWYCEPGDVILHPPFDLHTNQFTKMRTRILNFPCRYVELTQLENFGYAVLRAIDADELIKCQGDTDTVSQLIMTATPTQKLPSSNWVDMMAEDLCNNPKLTIHDAAVHYQIRPEHASREFRKRFGLPPARFRAEHRLQTALRLLCDKTMNVAEVALTAGYSDHAHLARHLLSATGMTATALRQNIN